MLDGCKNIKEGFIREKQGEKIGNQGKILIKKQLKSVKFGELKLVIVAKPF